MISDTSNVWVLVNVYQKDLPYVRVGDPVTIQTDAYPQAFHGRISYIAAALDPEYADLASAHRDRKSRRKIEEGHVRDRHGKRGKDSEALWCCPMPRFCAITRTSLSSMPKLRRTSSAGAR